MNLDSKLFDSIRIKPDTDRRKKKQQEETCEWPGCEKKGGCKAPKRGSGGREFHNFCEAHAREFNRNYNYFSGMDDDTADTVKASTATGDRPTWKMGVNAWGNATETAGETMGRSWETTGFSDGRAQRAAERMKRRSRHKDQTRKLRPLEAKAFETLGLKLPATADDVKRAYKRLLKENHPDLNKGDRACEERLQDVIAAYNTLRAGGYVG
ncbi:J domain-containing protein [uncultured Cohaesibacter sp.]|uniref:J domain-containing protein n=1 Tax=uncultured Cohaesibacter sp. TaxID=1002546 RepID=UPI002A0A62BF|nr:J domain-containing protein [uncultured Cohaesibacter sp.]